MRKIGLSFVSFHGGVNEIGGNKILLEDKDVKIWLDFGQSFVYGADYFVDRLTPRRITGCKDHFEFGLLPKMPGLYRRTLLLETALKYTEPCFDAVFLSHAHFDHMAHIAFLDETIPVYLGAATRTFIESQETTTAGADYGEHNYVTFSTGGRIGIDHIEVEPVHVDHSIPASYGFIIHTSKGSIAYTGDLRMHGPMAKMTEDFLERARQEKPLCLIVEGTRVTPSEKRMNLTEEQVLNGVTRITERCSGLVLATSHSRDVDRFRTFYQSSVRNGRIFIIQPRTAYLMNQLADRMDVPNILEDDSIRIFFKRKKSGNYDDRDYYEWERPFLGRIITPEEIHQNQSDYLVHLTFNDFAELIDIRPAAGSDFIYSMSEPFTEEDISYEIMHNWLRHFGLRFHQLHASGHASKDDVSAIIRTIKPRKVIPLHTEYPRLFKKIVRNIKVEIPILGLRMRA